MKKVLVLLSTILAVSAVAQESKISTTPPLIATGYNTSEAFVIGMDMKTRHCPADFNVYVRNDRPKPADKNLYYVAPRQTLGPQQGDFKVFCIREDVH